MAIFILIWRIIKNNLFVYSLSANVALEIIIETRLKFISFLCETDNRFLVKKKFIARRIGSVVGVEHIKFQ